MKVVKSGLGLFVGLVCYAGLGWVLNETALGHTLLGAGLLFWLVGGMIGSMFLVLGWIIRFFSRGSIS